MLILSGCRAKRNRNNYTAVPAPTTVGAPALPEQNDSSGRRRAARRGFPEEMAPEFIFEEQKSTRQRRERKKEKKAFVEHLPCSFTIYSRKYSSTLTSNSLIWFSAELC